MQPSQLEIEREVEALRDIRRRSTAQGGPGSLILDPDLPNDAANGQAAYWSPTEESSSSSHESLLSETSSAAAQDDPFSLFWVPASLHPELAPKEFKEFLKEHARSPPDGSPPTRSNSSASIGGLGRKRSMLSRQYKPSPHDGVGENEEEPVVPLRRNRTSFLNMPQLTISDLQKLEELAEEASTSDDSSKLRSMLRRSLSLSIAPSVIDQMDDLRDPGDEADSPIIVPPPNQILRRSARTKIRKAGTGEGAHRFTATRSRRKSLTSTRANTMEPRSSSDMSSSDHGEGETIRRVPRSKDDIPDVPPLPRPESYSVETAIYDAYAAAGEDAEREFVNLSPPISRSPEIVTELVEEPQEVHEEPEEEVPLHHPQPQRALAPPTSDYPMPQRTPSPSSPSSSVLDLSASTSPSALDGVQRPPLQSGPSYQAPASPSPSEHRREKGNKGLFKWGGDKSGKKKEKDKGGEREKEKDPGFFGSLFGSKKKQDEPPLAANAAGREAAAALLGASKSSKNYVPPPSPQLGNYARYPIHVERAIYRLSHIKLANPRRPLYEQVLISNLMFWYLGVINKTGQNGQQPQQQGQQANAGAAAPQPTPSAADKERAEKEKRDQEERARAEKEKKESSRKGSLTKPAPNGQRRAETPVRGPQYEMQHRAIEQGYGAYGEQQPNGGPPPARTSSAPPHPMQRSPPSQQQPYSVQLVQPQPRNAGSPGSASSQYFEVGHEPPQLAPQQYPLVATGAPQLPPGAMPPVAVEQGWQQQNMSTNHAPTSPPPRQNSPPSSLPSSGSRRPRSPPQANRYSPQPYGGNQGGGKSPGRSLSATAQPSPPMAGMNGKVKKVMSAHAVPGRASEDEDLPLAVYQQQQRRKEY
ncbi:uncharacterized protein BXZ73DRAFT_51713 [Epithele typhae]|uniref:uncharacterized protein n=1 Tax=Epithele typhae TaxID=378194 RepID=UPI00200768B7|nr:uncharacterized protein BXZ73DRAFT_51713 [Epithele typhae]KAH9921721.1 hypothetical protein BXZ73DRAFT_51713 [Epithele typhae]